MSAAHPRVCGENFAGLASRAGRVGSSPRVRGKPGVGLLRVPADRLIPACAGKTRGDALEIEVLRAHPRVCGENL